MIFVSDNGCAHCPKTLATYARLGLTSAPRLTPPTTPNRMLAQLAKARLHPPKSLGEFKLTAIGHAAFVER